MPSPGSNSTLCQGPHPEMQQKEDYELHKCKYLLPEAALKNKDGWLQAVSKWIHTLDQ